LAYDFYIRLDSAFS